MSEVDLHPICLKDALTQTAFKYPHQESYVGPDARRTWQQTLDNSKNLAKALLALGLQRGDHVGILLGNCSQWIEIFFGCQMVNCINNKQWTTYRQQRKHNRKTDGRIENKFIRVG